MLRILIFLGAGFLTLGLGAQSATGDRYYREGKFSRAAQEYEKSKRAVGRYNAGNAAYRMGKYEAATALFEEAARQSPDARLRSDAYFNLGNALIKQGQYEKAARAYTQSLRKAAGRADAKKNLAIAKKFLQSNPPPPPPAFTPPPATRISDFVDLPAKNRFDKGDKIQMTPEAARKILAQGQPAELKNAAAYRTLVPNSGRSLQKKDW